MQHATCVTRCRWMHDDAPHGAGDFVYCTCGECVECLQDVQTAAAILGDRQRALTELEGTEECAALPLPQRCASLCWGGMVGVLRGVMVASVWWPCLHGGVHTDFSY